MVRLNDHVVLTEPLTSVPISFHAGLLTISIYPLTSSQPVPMGGLSLGALHWSNQASKALL